MRKGMQKMLEAKDISFAYSGGRMLYDGLSLQIAPGERVALCLRASEKRRYAVFLLAT